jgi:hypothetical protein
MDTSSATKHFNPERKEDLRSGIVNNDEVLVMIGPMPLEHVRRKRMSVKEKPFDSTLCKATTRRGNGAEVECVDNDSYNGQS